MKRYSIPYTISGLALLLCLPAAAQKKAAKDTTVTRTVVVEQEYIPQISDADKVNVLPAVKEPTVPKSAVDYATTVRPASSITPGRMPSFSAKEQQATEKPGYARLGYGNDWNLDLLANYLFRLSERGGLNLRFGMDGMNGKVDNDPFFRSRYYRTRAQADFSHRFDGAALSVGGNFGLSNFNYLPTSTANKQKLTSGDVYASLRSTDKNADFRFGGEAGLLFYGRQHSGIISSTYTPIRETIVRLKGDVAGVVGDQQTLTIAAEMNHFRYGSDAPQAGQQAYADFNSYTAIRLNPYYEISGESWKLRAGGRTDLSFGFGRSYRLAPDLAASLRFAEQYVLYAQIQGGTLLNDFRRAEQINPYAVFAQQEGTDAYAGQYYVIRPRDTFEQLNASAGLKASPFAGFRFHLYAGFQKLTDDLSYLMESPATNSALTTNRVSFVQGKTENTYAGFELSYDYKETFGISAGYVYRKWNAKDNDLLLAVKPVNQIAIKAHLRPTTDWLIYAGYDYINRKAAGGNYPSMPAVSNLHAGVDYQIFQDISIYARLNNLLSQEFQQYWGYPAQGFNFFGGLTFRF